MLKTNCPQGFCKAPLLGDLRRRLVPAGRRIPTGMRTDKVPNRGTTIPKYKLRIAAAERLRQLLLSKRNRVCGGRIVRNCRRGFAVVLQGLVLVP